MVEREALLALAERCEKATGPDMDLDLAIGEAVGTWPAAPHTFRFPKRYSRSLDAAMSLVPQSGGDTLVFCRSGNDGEGGNPDTFKAEVLVCTGFTSKLFTATAATEPLARVAAALRARAAQGNPQ